MPGGPSTPGHTLTGAPPLVSPQPVDEYVQDVEERYAEARDSKKEVLEARLHSVNCMLAAVEVAEERLRSRMVAEASLQERAIAALRAPGTAVAPRPNA